MAKLTEQQIEARRMSPGEVIARLSEQARGNIGDFVTIEGGEARIDLDKARRRHKLHLIKRLRLGERGVEVDLYDAQDALIQLGRHYRLFVDRVQTDDWRNRAVEDIKAGRLTFEVLANAFDETLAAELFQQAEVEWGTSSQTI